ncbi:hypothetical protein CCACVL1_19560 [Corchorus capsularis]|uniref:Uncharacterized protein n=1 Tax=Corchorus capsularis TaxID=210143 RepID=A0A1R3HG11_COCAP|nr:hypothetical protein CCACVL1_19560 [Corchorus capsularis]
MLFSLTTLNLARFLTKSAPKMPEGKPNVQAVSALEAWKHSDSPCQNYVLNSLSDTLYNVYCVHKTAKQLWSALDHKYMIEDVGANKFIVRRFFNFLMVDSKSVAAQVQKLQVILHEIQAEGITLCQSFQVVVMIEKLPPRWKDFKNYLKHKRKEINMEELMVRLWIEDDNRKPEHRASMSAKAKIVEHKQGLSFKVVTIWFFKLKRQWEKEDRKREREMNQRYQLEIDGLVLQRDKLRWEREEENRLMEEERRLRFDLTVEEEQKFQEAEESARNSIISFISPHLKSTKTLIVRLDPLDFVPFRNELLLLYYSKGLSILTESSMESTGESTSSTEISEIRKELKEFVDQTNHIITSLAKMFADFMNIQSQASAQIPSYVPQRYMREDTQGYGINAIEETQQWYAQKIGLSVAPISPSTPPSAPIFPDVPPPMAVINDNLPKDEEIPVESKKDQPTSLPKASQPRSRFEGMKKMETIYGPPPFPQRFVPQSKTCNKESQSDSLQKREVHIPLIAAIQEVPKEQWKPVDLVETTQRHQGPIVKEFKGVLSKTINNPYELDLQDSFQFLFNNEEDEPSMVDVSVLPKEVSKIVHEESEATKEDIKMDIPPPSPPKIRRRQGKSH